MFGRIARSWPRLVAGMTLMGLFLGLCAVTGAAGDNVMPPPPADEPLRIVAYAAAILITLFIVVSVPIVVFAVFAPSLLNLIELLALALIATIPFALLREAAALPAWVDCFAIFGFYLVFFNILSGRWLAWLGRRDSRTYRMSFVVPDGPDAVWSRIAPLPENAATFYWPKAEFMAAPEGSDADFVLHAPRRSGLQPAIEATWIEAIEPGRHLTHRSEPLPGSFGVKERQSLTLTPLGTRTKVNVQVTFLDVSLPVRIRLWLNNDASDFAASLRNRARGRRDGSVHGRQVLPA